LRHDDVDLQIDELGGESWKLILLSVSPPPDVDDVLLLDVAELLQGLSQRSRWQTVCRSPAAGEERDPPRLARLLRAGGARCGRQAEREAGDEERRLIICPGRSDGQAERSVGQLGTDEPERSA
jgi:hypothetical protein